MAVRSNKDSVPPQEVRLEFMLGSSIERTAKELRISKKEAEEALRIEIKRLQDYCRNYCEKH